MDADKILGRKEDEPHLTKDELWMVHKAIQNTKVPSWITRVPKNVGFCSAGSLKAAEWLILYTVYYPLALIPIWIHQNRTFEPQDAEGKATTKHNELKLDSTVHLICIANILMKRQISNTEIEKLEQLMHKYRQILQAGWPTQKSKPNVHITQHYLEVIKRFGPPMATAAWAHERLNGILGRIPKNNHSGELIVIVMT